MKTLIILAALSLTACADMTPTQRHIAYGVGAVLVLGAIAAHEVDHGGNMVEPEAKRAFHPSCQTQKGC